MSDISENETNEEINEEIPLTKPKGATRSPMTPDPTTSGIVKKPRSQKQIEAFEKVKQRRKENLEAKKQEKIINSAKLLIEEETKRKPLLEPTVPVKPPSRRYGGKGERRAPSPEEEEEEEEEIIVVKKAKPKRGLRPHASPDHKRNCKVRKIIIEESSSSEEEEEEIEDEPEPPHVKRRKNNPVRVIRPNPNDFFC